MPIYEYECPTCAKVKEVFIKSITSKLEPYCFCGSKMNKLISMSSFHLKGDGWYATKDRRVYKDN